MQWEASCFENLFLLVHFRPDHFRMVLDMSLDGPQSVRQATTPQSCWLLPHTSTLLSGPTCISVSINSHYLCWLGNALLANSKTATELRYLYYSSQYQNTTTKLIWNCATHIQNLRLSNFFLTITFRCCHHQHSRIQKRVKEEELEAFNWQSSCRNWETEANT